MAGQRHLRVIVSNRERMRSINSGFVVFLLIQKTYADYNLDQNK